MADPVFFIYLFIHLRSSGAALDRSPPSLWFEGRAVAQGAAGLLDCDIKCLIVSPLIHSARLEEDVSWAVERSAEDGWIEAKEGSLSKAVPRPPPLQKKKKPHPLPRPYTPFTSAITANGGEEGGGGGGRPRLE